MNKKKPNTPDLLYRKPENPPTLENTLNDLETLAKMQEMVKRFENKLPHEYNWGETKNPQLVPYLQRGGTRKIADAPIPCHSSEHNPPSHMVFPPGTYEHTCPSCGKRTVFTVDQVWC